MYCLLIIKILESLQITLIMVPVQIIKSGSCPDGFTKDKNGCRQVCTHCNYRDDEPKSRYMNEYDICEPDGYFNGIDSYGNIK